MSVAPDMNSAGGAAWAPRVEFAASRGATSGDDTDWFAVHVQPHERTLRRYLQRRFPSLPDVDDVVQETYARIFRQRRLGKIFEARSYLFRVARNVTIDVFRRSRTTAVGGLTELANLGVVDERPNAAEFASRHQELRMLEEAIRLLPLRCREVFVLRRLRGLSHREIAQRFGTSEHTIDAQLCTALFRCRQYFVSAGLRHASA